jgi:transcriptional regulator with XRE-family HTH domain
MSNVSSLPSTGAVPEWDLTDRLVKARKFAGVEQSEIAEFLGLSRGAISVMETGRVVPRLGYLRLWAQRCDVSLDWLRFGDRPAPDDDQEVAVTSTEWSNRANHLYLVAV